jgi:branched-subunit amino acid aminotransferase/4-amino-4-deoxychorismate lyase
VIDGPHRHECLVWFADRATRIDRHAARVAAEVRALGLDKYQWWAQELLAEADRNEEREAG